jgi:hypothetical protein
MNALVAMVLVVFLADSHMLHCLSGFAAAAEPGAVW